MKKNNATPKHSANHEIVTLALYVLGGATRHVDTEDIAIKANELAPGRFAWRKYPNQINIEIVRAFLSDAKKIKNGKYILGSGNEGWMLTPEGLKFAKSASNALKDVSLAGIRHTPQEKKWLKNERARLLHTPAYGKYKAGLNHKITVREAETFFRIDDYVVGVARKRMVLRIVNAFSADRDLGKAVKELSLMVRGMEQ